MNDLQQALGVEIRDLRLRQDDVTQDEFSRRSGISRATIANIERGRQSVSVNTLYKLCAALGISAGDMLNRAIERAFPTGDKTISLADVDNKIDVLNTVNKYI